MSDIKSIKLSDITEIVDRLPVGRGYIARLASVEGKQSKANKPMIQATWEVISGEFTGYETTTYYSLSVTTGRKGGTFASGVIEQRKLFAAIGKPLPPTHDFSLEPAEAQKLFAGKLRGVNVELAVFEEKDSKGTKNDDGTDKVYTRTKVIGLASTASPATTVAEDYKDAYGD